MKYGALLLALFASCALAQETIPPPNAVGKVEVVNDPLKIIAPMFRPADLRSIVRRVEVGEGKNASRRFQFNEPVELQEVTIINDGDCRARIFINDLLAKILVREPPGGIFAVREPPGGVEWRPPLTLDLSPNDSVRVQLISEKIPCSAEILVLGSVPPETDVPPVEPL